MTEFKKLKFLILIIAAFCIFDFNVSAQSDDFIKGSEKLLVRYKSDEKTQCFAFNKYLVKTYLKDNTKENIGDGTGVEIEVFKRDVKYPLKKSCEIAADVLLNIKNEEGNEFGGVFGDRIFIKRNVFPDGADLDVYDLKTKAKVFTTEFSEWDNYAMNISNARFLNYRQWSKKDGLLKNCPQGAKWKRDGFGISWLQTKRLDLQTLKEVSIGALRCINVQ